MLVHVPRRIYRRPLIVSLSIIFFCLALIVFNLINRSNTNKNSVPICSGTSKVTSTDILTLLNDSYGQSSNDIFAQLCDLRHKPNTENFTSNVGSPLMECGIVPPLYPFEKRFRTVPRLKINICAIKKNMSTVLTAIACFLFNQKKFRERNRHINTISINVCADFQTKHFPLSISHTNLTFREPVDRFLSGFVDKCIQEKIWRRFPKRCNECQQNISCFLEREHTRMMGFARGERLNSFDDRHFFPQNWRCDFSAHLRRFRFVRYSPDVKGTKTFFSNVFALLRQWNVTNDEISFVESQVSEGRTEHATFSTAERRKIEIQVRSSPQMMRRLVQMYYYDFALFGYPLPDIPL
ncbi:sulfotransferase family domain-containing protein [Ditylenchus destructor]|nr:sulfotransferase family domain-containing protein [Ditylenchus destructor]